MAINKEIDVRFVVGYTPLEFRDTLNPRRQSVGHVDVKRLDITETNKAVQELIEVTENPRHSYLLQAYDRHRNLEHAGRFEEIFGPEMTVEHPVYRFDMLVSRR